ncbi:nuclear transport factor 2 family protein [Novosphingobium album (ex Hu et al. 2023)]|uniref:Nuclear transport factor 2 family protein n=1 Tax=Novosphingobium album (ex Hu et al. 2023) TaxID=2930093 RepID=A0ABT0AXC7_9SPHN|nr:nuclear transport factor 2 family protein [Novosphingobium album (ex Hu et al. 2023)]MCJ2177331.1 nuclear transport factor 2 family protein [Novosphingobium album (ex Hu et al. 2023)]
MTPIEELLARDEIRTLKARYFRTFDTKDWNAFLSLFTEDATLEFDLAVPVQGQQTPSVRLEGQRAIGEHVSSPDVTAQTVHHGHTCEIEILSSDEARGIWAMEDIVDYGRTLIHGYGHYHETYRRTGAGWRIASVHLTRLRYKQTLQDRIVL